MKTIVKRRRSRRYLLAIFFIVIISVLVFWWVVWADFGHKKDQAEVGNKHPEKTQVKAVSESSVVPKKVIVSAEPAFVPDYQIPPITDGIAPVLTNIPTDQKVVFLGIDDGTFKDQSVVDIMRQNHIKATLFLSKAFIASDPDFFKQLVDLGSLIENHTLSHDISMVTGEDYNQQKAEICGMADYAFENYGRRPVFFRPPGGAYSATMRQAAADCGMKAVVNWVAKANGGSMQYQIGDKLRPGDIVLMHFRPEFRQDMQAFVDAETAAGLHTELLEDLLAK